MAHWLDLDRGSDSVECLCRIRRRFTVSRPCHAESPRHIRPAEMAGNAVLLVSTGILGCIEHLGLETSTNREFGIRYLVATL